MALPKDPEKLKEWLSHQSKKVQKRWAKPGAIEAHREKHNALAKVNAQRGQESPCWKGDNIKYNSIHLLMAKVKPRPQACEMCNEPERKTLMKNGRKRSNLELASIDHKYTRNPKDYIWVCCTCHKRMDRTRYNRLTRSKQHFFNQYYQANISIIPAL